MQYKDITIFLELVRTRNITKTAENLFLSQSTVSSRLKSLEDALGCQLVIRSKGQRTIQLTRSGKDFILVAERWKNLFEETEALCNAASKTLRIASNESTYHGYIIPFLLQFFEAHPEYNISMQICDSEQIYDFIEKNLIDLGFVSYESDRAGITCQLIKRVPLCIVKYAEKTQEPLQIHPQDLDAKDEIQFIGGQFNGMKRWREKWFGKNTKCSFEVNSSVGIYRFLEHTERWVIIPIKFAQMVAEKQPLQIFYLDDEPVFWEVFILKKCMKAENMEVCETFERELLRFIHET